MVLKTPIWLVHLAANQSSANEHTYDISKTSDVAVDIIWDITNY